MDDFQSASDRFMTWFSNHPQASINRKITLADLRAKDAGRGVVAMEDLDEDEELFSIPLSMILSVKNSDLSTKAPEIFLGLDPWLSLVVVMIYEYLRGATSAWKPYLDLFPTNFDSLMFWTTEELCELQGSTVIDKIGKATADESIRTQIIPRLQKFSNLFPPRSLTQGTPLDISALAHRMASTILAYAFDLGNDDESTTSSTMSTNGNGDSSGLVEDDDMTDNPDKGMIPLADLLNADAQYNNARLFHSSSCLTMRSLHPIRKGEEIYNDYGPLPPSDLLRRYGYVTENYDQYAVLELPSRLILEAVEKVSPKSLEQFEAAKTYLVSHDLWEDSFDLSCPTPLSTAFPTELLVATATLLLDKSALSEMERKDRLPKPTLNLTITQVLRCALGNLAQNHTTTIADDEEWLRREQLSKRLRFAVMVRLGEKRILQKALRELAEKSAQLSDAPNSAPATKRERADEVSGGKRQRLA